MGTSPDFCPVRLGRTLIRSQVGVRLDPEQARDVAEQAIRAAAEVKDNPADLIRARCELPG
jgi:hypothetical protein